MKKFNTTGTCYPNKHYMVDISNQVNKAVDLIKDNTYFCINRGRQFGKTTTINVLKKELENQGYAVFSLSFEGLDESNFETVDNVCATFLRIMNIQITRNKVTNISQKSIDFLSEYQNITTYDSIKLQNLVYQLCADNPNVVVIIDEVDQASNSDSFVKFLGFFRSLYLKRDEDPTFQSIILAGVYDVKNLKLKMRPNEEHQYNSPWNIAVSFKADMSLPVVGIAKMLNEYKLDTNQDFDENYIAQIIHDWTSGYPYLVSRICQLIDTEKYGWNNDGIIEAVKYILNDRDDLLFKDMMKKISDFPKLRQILYSMLYAGNLIGYNPNEPNLDLGFMFNFLKNVNRKVEVFCRLFETRIYNLFIEQENLSELYCQGGRDKNSFIKDGDLDVKRIMEKFAIHFHDIYGEKNERFVEAEGRKFFMLYLRPIINGIGNYYVESQTRDYTRTDIIIDYKSKQYIIELKIWNGEEYNRKGEIQLSEYLDYYHLNEGYMLSFCFNKNKTIGPKTVEINNKILHEVIV
ncbi:MAG: AAA-like domain-containing protein [Bacteroidales bacterium]|nr:AAA-like domain-containing protein [Bacteroidales bacterium]